MRKFIEETLREAGALALSLVNGVRSERKSDRSLVSEADRKVEICIKERVAARFPEDRMIGEEHGAARDNRNQAQRLWAIDPIDGTNPFLNGLPSWGVCIGILDGGEVLAGGVYLPKLNELFTAVRGEGAMRNGEPMPHLTPMEIDNQTILLSPASRKRFYKMDYPGKSMAFGSASVHVVYAATGSGVAALVDRPYIWDILGPLAIIQEVGGGAWHTDGRPLDLTTLAHGEKEKLPLFFGLRENAEKLFPMIEIYPRPEK